MPGKALERIKNRLAANRDRSKAARAALVQRLAAMSLDQLRRVPPKIWKRLDAADLADLISQSRALEHLKLVQQKGTAPAVNQPKVRKSRVPVLIASVVKQFRHWRSVEPLWWVALRSLVKTGLVATLLVAAVPGIRTIAENQWWIERSMWCRELDRWTNNCNYKVESESGLTLAQAARRLHLSYDDLWMMNELKPDDYVYRRGEYIYVPQRSPLDYLRW
ncbi:MAG: hypothetical protein HC909_02350 [Blastochloris sp.]|nr:hypothetical protein [Blastochloris sp.]